MTAGMVSVPTIVPLKAPGFGRKWEINTRTPVEFSSNTSDTIIFYTVDGTKPDPFKKLGQSSTFKYTQPIYLGKGKITLKAMAVLKDGTKESRINTKTFQISDALDDSETDEEKENEEDEEEHFLEGKERAKETVKSGYYDIKSPYTDYQTSGDTSTGGLKTAWGKGNESSYARDFKPSSGRFLNEMLAADVSGKEGDFRQASREYTKKEDSGVRKVLNGVAFQKMQISSYDDDSNRFYENEILRTWNGYPRTAFPPKSGVTAKYIQEEIDLFKCLYCHAVRPDDTYARFCNECGGALPPIPGTRSLPSKDGMIGPCPLCYSKVPLNAPSCIVCDGIFQGKPVDVSTKLVEKIVCLQCGTTSPSGSKRCVVCETILPVQKVFTQNVINKPPQPSRDSFLQCSKCERINSHDARFCDWCGSKPLPSSSVVTCLTCRTNNQPYARYCASCGQNISPPVRPDYSSFYTNQNSIPHAKNLLSYPGEGARWHSVPTVSQRADMKSYGTQTSGLQHFPSSKTIDSQCKNNEDRSKLSKPLSAISPGKGYWRQQIDHVSQHLKVYAQNNIEFRDAISQIRMGKLLGALAQEELNGTELSITLSFGLRNKDGHSLNATSKTVQHSIAFINAMKNSKQAKDINGNTDGKKRRVRKKVKKKLVSKDSKLSAETVKLLKMLGGTDDVEADSVNELIDHGADVDAINSEGITPLKMAVTSKHIDAIQVLLDAGATYNLKSGSKGNTVLHEAVRLGMDGVEAADKLLEAGADPDIVNDAGKSPYDLALKSGADALISKFTANLGQELLKETIG